MRFRVLDMPLLAALTMIVSSAATPLTAQGAGNQRPPDPGPRMDMTGVGDTSLFAPLNLPVGNIYRSGSGAPGPKYWEQRAELRLARHVGHGGEGAAGRDDTSLYQQFA